MGEERRRRKEEKKKILWRQGRVQLPPVGKLVRVGSCQSDRPRARGRAREERERERDQQKEEKISAPDSM